MQTIVSKHKVIAKLWNETQHYLKVCEQETSFVFIPAINELRYAARKLLDAWIIIEDGRKQATFPPPLKREVMSKLDIAEQYLVNAHHDITDEIIGSTKEALDAWLGRYGPQVFQSVTHKKHAIDEKIRAAEGLVTESRMNRENRKSLYVGLRDDHVPAIISEYNDLEKSLIENVGNIYELQSVVQTTRRNQHIALGIGALGLLVGLSRFII